MGKINLYFAGCISRNYLDDEYYKATKWRKWLAQRLKEDSAKRGFKKWSWFDPTIGFEENYNSVNNKSVLQQNIYYLDNADIMVTDLNNLEHSPGTLFEIYYFGMKNKPIICFGWSEWAEKPHIEPFITAHLKEDEIFTYLDSLYYQ